MKLENKYSTVSQSQRLKELGIIQGKSERYWYTGDTGNNIDHLNITGSNYKGDDMCYSAFDVAELLYMLPQGSYETGWSQPELFPIGEMSYNYVAKGYRYLIVRNNYKTHDKREFYGTTAAECVAHLLIHELENKLTTPESVNERLQNS